MFNKLKKQIANNIRVSKAEEKIRELNDNDKSIRILKRLRILATSKALNIIGVVLFIFIFIITNILIRLIDFIFFKFNNANISYPIYKFILPKFEFWLIYLIVFLFLIVFYIKLRINIKASFENLEKGQKGSGRLSTLKEIQNEYHEIPEKREKFKGKGGVPISRVGDKIYIDISSTHTIVIGTTRSGKGQGFVLITIDIYSRAREKSSLVFNDPKGELCGMSKELLEREGYEVKVIDFLEMNNSIGYNPLEIIKEAWREGDFAEAELRCRTFTFAMYHNTKSHDSTWEDLSMNLVNALILALCERCIKTNKERESMTKEELEYWDKEEMKVNLFSVANMLGELGGKELEEGTGIDIYFDNLPKESIAKRQYNTVKFAKSKTRASVFVTASMKLQVYLGERVAKLTSFNDIKLEEIGFYKSDTKKVNVIIIDADRPNENDENKNIEDNINNIESNDRKDETVQLFGTKNIIIYKDDKFSEERIRSGVTALGVKGEDLTDKIEINHSRVMWGTAGIYEMEYSVCDKENSKPIALFLIVPDFDKSNHVLSTTCISQITYMLSRKASLSKSGSTDREVVFILDEAGNMSPIENFAETLTVCLGRGLKFIPIVQSFAQLKEMYGENYKTLVDNCANTVYIMSTDVDTTEEISKMTGEKTIVTNSRQGSVLSLDKNITESLETVPVIRYDDLMRLKLGENVVIKPMHRQDLKGNKTVSYPILNTEEMGMKFQYEYLSDVFSKNSSMRNIYIKNSFNTVSLEELKVDFEDEMVDLIKNKMQQIIEENALRDYQRERAKKALEAEKAKENKGVKEENNKGKLKKSKKAEIIKLLDSMLSNSEIEVIEEIENIDDMKEYIRNLKVEEKVGDDVLKKLNNIINK
ncbi:type IV secretory system conjugative DNA transfer family protein [Clostridium sp. DSM 100503]|uniref:VirD4-like conjugal transfer protein, CD1115 family n=1 Tax=Clostridium sp. DSM 100503 TaxID=2963282 RepID=UPI00214A3761|nr:type IV secretory system conjugative DNA transfer family protein [Clostridium sp. DSM 100503]MCR1952917.1 type IV secretory system conjugative DNA transfer family protein [Clostridium sp. DSM 100503]